MKMILLIVWLRLKIKDDRSNGSRPGRQAGKQALHLTVPVQLE